jgi:exopolysaccharide biosynthesis polyprenyl glycosylphosphotransferase
MFSSSLARSGTLFIVDLVGLYSAYNLAYKLRFGEWIPANSSYLWIVILIAILVMYVMDVYRLNITIASDQLPLDTFVAVLVVAIASMLSTYIVGVSKFNPLFGRGVMPVAMFMFAVWAPFSRWVFVKWYKKGFEVKNWLLVGGKGAFEAFNEENELKFPNQKTTRMDAGSSGDEFRQWLTQNTERFGIIIDNDVQLNEEVFDILNSLHAGEIPIFTIAEYYERFWMKLPVLRLQYGWYIRNRRFNLLHDRIGLRLKRVADFVFALVGIVLTLPVIVIISILIYFDSPGNIIFKQRRVGLNGKVFTLYKFRSMVRDAEKGGAQWASAGDSRVTKFGKFIRASRLDELPQFWNILLGDMSLIGPRPERPEFVEQLKKEIPFYNLRHQVPPGVTGWAQVMYSYGSTVKDARIKLEYDLYYIKYHSIGLDLAIIVKTFVVILKGRGR